MIPRTGGGNWRTKKRGKGGGRGGRVGWGRVTRYTCSWEDRRRRLRLLEKEEIEVETPIISSFTPPPFGA